MNKKTIFPNYEVNEHEYRTYLRKEHNKEWYLMLVLVKSHGDNSLKLFLNYIYKAILFGTVNVDLKDSNGALIFTKDENQQSEEERLLSHPYPKS